ncbi:hypothetical protein CL634_02055 [bacterium]|nr:hypothetical protein [bacterium]|tara:strand:- start:115 stop:966 length:852 start_codon:yes stop_codon:yes gene_type:complete
MNKLIIISTCDQEYIPILKPFLRSLRKNATCVQPYIRFVNTNPGSIEEAIDEFPEMWFVIEEKELDTKRKHLNKKGILLQEELDRGFKEKKTEFRGARWLYSDKMAYCSNIRYNTVNQALSAGLEHILMMDIDAIVRRDLDELYNLIKSHDLCVVSSNSEDFINRQLGEEETKRLRFPELEEFYHGGLIGIRNSLTMREIFKKIEKNINLYDWDSDELVISKIFTEHEGEIDIHNLSRKYKDEGLYTKGYVCPVFQEDSVIWSGTANTKSTNEVYAKELKLYE